MIQIKMLKNNNMSCKKRGSFRKSKSHRSETKKFILRSLSMDKRRILRCLGYDKLSKWS